MSLNHVSDHESHCLKASHKIQMYNLLSNSIYHLPSLHRSPSFLSIPQASALLPPGPLPCLLPSTSPDLHMFTVLVLVVS